MMRLSGFVLACLGMVVVALGTGKDAHAQGAGDPGAYRRSAGDGVLNAVAYRPLPPGSSIAVRPLDNSDENQVLQQVFERELRAGGYTVSKDANLVLTFETRGQVGAWSDGGRRQLLQLQQSQGVGGLDSPKVRLNLYDSRRGAVFNEGRTGTQITTPSTYRLDATIDDRTDGKRLWQAWTTAAVGGSDGFTLTKAMVPVMVAGIGLTVKRQTFTLR